MAMEMKFGLGLKMTQKLVMTPMLQQAIKLLPLARLELAQLVRQELVENPILEEILEEEPGVEEEAETEDFDIEEPPPEETGDGDPDNKEEDIFAEDHFRETDVQFKEETLQTKDAESAPEQQEVDWDSFIQNNLDGGMAVDNYTERPSIDATFRRDPSLAEHLHWQLDLTVHSEEDKVIGSCIIGNIQNDGYLAVDLSEIADICQAPLADVERVLSVIQGFEPTGVGARSLKECLLIQARSLPERSPLLENLIENFLERLEERYIPKVAAELKVPVQEILSALQQIREFDPKPGLTYSSERIDYVVPDLVVCKNSNGEYFLTLNEEDVPRLRINPFYHNLLKTTQEGQTREYLENKYRSAMWFIKSIDQRRQTIYKVGNSIIKLQREFLEKGLAYLKPMVLKDVAKDIEMHESTVSRITTNKYIDTPQGIFELKYFFHSGIKSYMGSNLSSIRVKNMIKEVVQQEDRRKPLTDDEMVQILMKKNAKIARRTVTKYRKELNIPPASKRKKLF